MPKDKGTTFKQRLEAGKEGEREVGQVLISKGFPILPLYQFLDHGESPFVFTKDSKHKLPDFIIFTKEGPAFIECKQKNQWVGPGWRRKYGLDDYPDDLETGFDNYQLREYINIFKSTGVPVWFCFHHISNPPFGVYLLKMEEGLKYKRTWSHEAFFPKSILTPLVESNEK